MFSVFSDSGDPHGNRHWTAWDEMPADFASLSGDLRTTVQLLLGYASDCRSQFVRAGRIATGEDGLPPLALNGQAAFYAALVPVILQVAADVHDGAEVDVDAYVRAVTRAAVREFERATESLLVPARVADVAQARAAFSRMLHASRLRRFPQTLTKETA